MCVFARILKIYFGILSCVGMCCLDSASPANWDTTKDDLQERKDGPLLEILLATASPSIQDKTKMPLLRLFCANGHQEPSVDCTFHGNNVKFTAPTKDLLIPVIFLAPQDYRRKHEIDRNIFWAKRPPRRITWPLPTRNFHKGLVDQTCMTSMTTMTSIADSAPHTTSPLPIDSEPDRIPKTLTELFQMKRQGNMLHPATKRRYQQSNFSNFETKWL